MLKSSNMEPGLLNFQTALHKMEDGRVRARTTINGKTLEAFGTNERHATLNLEKTVEQAALTGDVDLG